MTRGQTRKRPVPKETKELRFEHYHLNEGDPLESTVIGQVEHAVVMTEFDLIIDATEKAYWEAVLELGLAKEAELDAGNRRWPQAQDEEREE
jgi:hypothetical protein